MKKFIYRIVLLPAVMVLFLPPAGWGAVTPGPAGMENVVKGNSAFAFDLYHILKKKKGNLFFSPYSISTALAMTYGGARGNTEKQMTDVLHFTLPREDLHPAFSHLEEHLKAVQEKGSVELNAANSLWPQQDHPFLESFLQLMEHHYGAAVFFVDYKRACEKARKTINAWVAEQTRNKIKDLIKPGLLGSLTRLVLVNAIYFNGDWANRFDEKLTKDTPFYLSPKQSVLVPTMSRKGKFGYGETSGLKMLELPYAGGDLSMLIFLPKKRDGLGDIEKIMSRDKIVEWRRSMKKMDVRVYLPKFKMASQFELARILAGMGMQDAFSSRADFSGMDGTRELCISAVIHKAFVDVHEKGTEAAAATAVVIKRISAEAPHPVFRADHPFIFLIRDNTTGSILFLGRLVNPGK